MKVTPKVPIGQVACLGEQHVIVVGEPTCRCGVFVAKHVYRGPWAMHACERSDGSRTGRYNVARPEGPTFGEGRPFVFPTWKHHGDGDFPEHEARALVDRLNKEGA